MTDSLWFFLLLTVSVVIVISYQWGGKRNIRIIKKISEALERSLMPSEKEYTLVGGVAGFRAEYKRSPFKRIILLLNLLPRQSILYMPVAMLRRGFDTLEVLFYLEGDIDEEIHMVRHLRLRHLMPGIKNEEDLKRRDINIGGRSFYLVSKSNKKIENHMMTLLKLFGPESVIHIALTPYNNVLYVKLRITFAKINSLETALRKAVKKIERGIKN